MERDCDININKLDLTEADHVSDLYKGIQNKSLPVETVGESEKLHKLNQCLKHFYRSNLPQQSFGCSIWSMLRL